jgi:hypothetical protein
VFFVTCFLLTSLVLAEDTISFDAANPCLVPKIKDISILAPSSVLFVGNSFFYYNNSLHNHVSHLVAASRPEQHFHATSVTISGSGLSWHDVASYFRPDALGTYWFDNNNQVVFTDPRKPLFDIVIMMDSSQGPIHPQLKAVFTEYTKKDSDIIRQHGAIPVFFMSWAYADQPEMTQELAAAYTQAGNDNDVLVIPAGLAFARSIALRPDINLYAPDKRHPSIAGTYLAAATVYACLFNIVWQEVSFL